MSATRTIREAVVKSLAENAALVAAFAKGTIYDFSNDKRKPQELTKSDCPALIIGPTAVDYDYNTNVTADVTVDIDLTIVSDERDVGECEDLFDIVAAAVHAGMPEFGLTGADAPHLVSMRRAAFAPFETQIANDRGIEWKCETGVKATVRRAV